MAIRKVTIRSRKTRKVRGSRQGAIMRRRRNPITRGFPKRREDYARVVEGSESTISTNGFGLYTLNYTAQLSDFQRAQEVAHSYKYYRCAKIELQFVPYATFAVTNGAAAARMPQLYFTIDRVNNMWATPTEAEMIQRGISPKLFKRKYTFGFKPNLLQHVQLETHQPETAQGIDTINAINSIPLFNKWLPTQQTLGFKMPGGPYAQVGSQVVQAATNPYNLKYYGAVAVIDIEGGESIAIGDLITKVTWEFKGPRALTTQGTPGIEPSYSQATSTMNVPVVPNTQPTSYP